MNARALTAAEEEMIRGLVPHTALHVRSLLGAVPGLRLTSGRRSPLSNRAVGGVQGSYHLRGRAGDFGGSRADLAVGLRFAQADRVGPECTGPEECFIEEAGAPHSTGLHLHAAW